MKVADFDISVIDKHGDPVHEYYINSNEIRMTIEYEFNMNSYCIN